mmetsp:Transcript_62477/g.125160  ORF Transcript_62477/g.125160 Transcript_62477/m.125160 type:complete len:339 (-) Transcript_62477:279-1295(-)
MLWPTATTWSRTAVELHPLHRCPTRCRQSPVGGLQATSLQRTATTSWAAAAVEPTPARRQHHPHHHHPHQCQQRGQEARRRRRWRQGLASRAGSGTSRRPCSGPWCKSRTGWRTWPCSTLSWCGKTRGTRLWCRSVRRSRPPAAPRAPPPSTPRPPPCLRHHRRGLLLGSLPARCLRPPQQQQQQQSTSMELGSRLQTPVVVRGGCCWLCLGLRPVSSSSAASKRLEVALPEAPSMRRRRPRRRGRLGSGCSCPGASGTLRTPQSPGGCRTCTPNTPTAPQPLARLPMGPAAAEELAVLLAVLLDLKKASTRKWWRRRRRVGKTGWRRPRRQTRFEIR